MPQRPKEGAGSHPSAGHENKTIRWACRRVGLLTKGVRQAASNGAERAKEQSKGQSRAWG